MRLLLVLGLLAQTAFAANTPWNLPIFTNVADMSAHGSPMGVNKAAYVLGYYTPGDGGGGTFFATNASAVGNPLRVNSITNTWSWERQLDGRDVNITYFGASPSISDNSSYIQAASDWVTLTRTNYGGNIVIPGGGPFKYSTTWTIKRNATVKGWGRSGYMPEYGTTSGSELVYTGTGTAIYAHNTDTNVNSGNLHRIQLSGFRLHTDGTNYTSPKAAIGIDVNAEESWIDNVYVGGTHGDGFVKGMHFEDVSTASYVLASIFSDNHVALDLDNTDHGSPSDLTLSYNNIYHATNGVHLGGGLGVKILNNWFERDDQAIRIDNNTANGKTVVIDPKIENNLFNNGNVGETNSRFLMVKRTGTNVQFYVQGLVCNGNIMNVDANCDYAVELDAVTDVWSALNNWSFEYNDIRGARTNMYSSYAALYPVWMNNQNVTAVPEIRGSEASIHSPGFDVLGDGMGSSLTMGGTTYLQFSTPSTLPFPTYITTGTGPSDTNAQLAFAVKGTVNSNLLTFNVYSQFSDFSGTLRAEGPLQLYPPGTNDISYIWGGPGAGPYSVISVGGKGHLTYAPVKLTDFELYSTNIDFHGIVGLPELSGNTLLGIDGGKAVINASVSATSPLSLNYNLGILSASMTQADSTHSGFLTASDWTNFFNKGPNTWTNDGTYVTPVGGTNVYADRLKLKRAIWSGNNTETVWGGTPANESLVDIRVPGVNSDAGVPELWLSQNTAANLTADYGFMDVYPQTTSSVLTIGQKTSGTIRSAGFFANGTKTGVQYGVGANSSQDLAGTGSPEGVVTANVGSTYRRLDGGASTSFYVKESGTGNTGWIAYGASGGGITSRTGIVREQWFPADQLDIITNAAGGITVGTYVPTSTTSSFKTYDFASGVNNSYIGFTWSPPDAWNASDVKVKFYWTAQAGTVAQTVSWLGNAYSQSDGDTINITSSSTVSDAYQGADKLHVSDPLTITIANTPAVGDMLTMRFTRSPSDSLAGTAKLFGIKLQYQESSTEPTAW